MPSLFGANQSRRPGLQWAQEEIIFYPDHQEQWVLNKQITA